ncbi:FAD/NAD(P)-binding domain-containing protein [Fistulina hepatica ATCC 64428]|uniref:FAD/NAD(P)-binding domain-containing protein n=1 Tax=Fistulina hepatica ATCC 64428 TaxID=1128425 RepID=A0A0D7AEN5_9AGAR|nr:FAD/NAD(P)-binding domain-containing protein [Fistulina hepatica ATCC 64428]
MSYPSQVGAGVTGLTLALSLAQNGVSVRLVDENDAYREGQKGSGVQVSASQPTDNRHVLTLLTKPRTLELLNILGILPDVWQVSGPMLPCYLYELPGGTKIIKEWEMFPQLSPTPGCPYPNGRTVGQERHEQVLCKHLRKYGVEVERSTQLLSFQHNDDHVEAHTSKNGIESTASFQFLIGTDGAHSTVRKQAAFTFLGETRLEEQGLVTGDIRVLAVLPDQTHRHIWGDWNTIMISLRPCTHPDEGLFNFHCAGHFDHEKIISGGREEFIEFFYRVTGRYDIQFGELLWVSKYRPNIRMVDTFQKGRVFVAGGKRSACHVRVPEVLMPWLDAAHAHSPTGGQGLNSSMQDAFNLGWKLALVVRGLTSTKTLDSYTAERLPVITEMLNKSTALLDKTFSHSNDVTESWHRGNSLNQLGINYRDSPLVLEERNPMKAGISSTYEAAGVIRAGDRAPSAPLFDARSGQVCRLLDLFKATQHEVLVFTDDIRTAQLVQETSARCPLGTVECLIIAPQSAERVQELLSVTPCRVLQDNGGHAYKEYVVQNEPTIVVIRPDGVLGAVVLEVIGLERYFRHIFL